MLMLIDGGRRSWGARREEARSVAINIYHVCVKPLQAYEIYKVKAHIDVSIIELLSMTFYKGV